MVEAEGVSSEEQPCFRVGGTLIALLAEMPELFACTWMTAELNCLPRRAAHLYRTDPSAARWYWRHEKQEETLAERLSVLYPEPSSS